MGIASNIFFVIHVCRAANNEMSRQVRHDDPFKLLKLFNHFQLSIRMLTYLLLGADIGDKRTAFAKAKQLIGERVGRVVRESSLYESEAWGFESTTTFLNQVLEVATPLLPLDLLTELQQIEVALGRTRSGNGYESRLIDIDILFYDRLVIDIPELSIPHPHLHKRMFTLEPLNELIPDFIHPSLHKAVADLKAECIDEGLVRKING